MEWNFLRRKFLEDGRKLEEWIINKEERIGNYDW